MANINIIAARSGENDPYDLVYKKNGMHEKIKNKSEKRRDFANLRRLKA
ncbi:MAG: hypothetical protein PHQ02_05635 [Candidatus Riflebacteria bacterium]|nr:hypothetical protein [Candidatus Riflebacteria bacterium]